MARLLSGKVVSDKNDKTIVISVATRKTHPIYKKQYTINRKFMAHDENNEAKTGDIVTIRESRPLSARKRFTLDKVNQKAGVGFEETDATGDVVVDEPKVEEAKPKKTTKAKAKVTQPKIEAAEGSAE